MYVTECRYVNYEIGVVEVSGDHVFSGYWRKENETIKFSAMMVWYSDIGDR